MSSTAELCMSADLTIQASAGEQSDSSRRFEMVAYTGAPMKLRGYRNQVVVDLAGLSVPSQNRPILLDHESDVDSIAGQSDSITVMDGKLRVAGEILAGTGRVSNVLSLASRGFRWQASIGASPEKVEDLRAGETAIVNGAEVKGPLTLVRQATLREISIVAMGADDRTSSVIAATAAEPEDDEMSMENDDMDLVDVTANAIAATAVEVAKASGFDNSEEIKTLQASIDALTQQVKNMSELADVRDSRPAAPAIHVEAAPGYDVLEAALCRGAGLPSYEEQFSEQTLEASNKSFRRGIGLQELLIEAARLNGYRGRAVVNDDTLPEVLKASFSTLSIPGLLSNTANKFLLTAFNSVDQSWRQVASTRSVSDFKSYTSYRLTGGLTMEKVGPGGEIKHGTVGEMEYKNSAETYGRMISITRQMLINDDLGALTQLPARLGRGAAIAFNKVFWTEFLADNANFYTAGRGNFISGAGTVLSIDSLSQAEKAFMEQTDPDGDPLSVAPATLVVPPALYTLATTLMKSTEIRDTNANQKYPTLNPHAGKFGVVNTPYLNTANVPGGSATAWFLLANPGDMSVIEVAFLNGNESPIVEQAQASFETLGIQMRSYWDFGAAKQEYRAGLKSKGAA